MKEREKGGYHTTTTKDIVFIRHTWCAFPLSFSTQSLDAARGRAVHHVVLLENTTAAAGRTGAGGRQVVGVRDVVVVLGELLEGLALGLLDEQRGEDAA